MGAMTNVHMLAAAEMSGQRMTTREIASLTGKQHKHVLRDCRTMLEAISMSEEGLAQFWTDPQNGQQHKEFALTQELTMTLVTGYSIALRHAVMARWIELEAKNSPKPIMQLPDFNDPIAAARAWADAKEAEQLAVRQLEAAKPQVEALARIAGEDGANTLRETAKLLGVGERRLIDWLLSDSMHWLYRDAKGRLQGFAHRIESGHLRHDLTHVRGMEAHLASVKVTKKGLARLAVIRERGGGAAFLEKCPKLLAA